MEKPLPDRRFAKIMVVNPMHCNGELRLLKPLPAITKPCGKLAGRTRELAANLFFAGVLPGFRDSSWLSEVEPWLRLFSNCHCCPYRCGSVACTLSKERGCNATLERDCFCCIACCIEDVSTSGYYSLAVALLVACNNISCTVASTQHHKLNYA
jgi:hypothetical protein